MDRDEIVEMMEQRVKEWEEIEAQFKEERRYFDLPFVVAHKNCILGLLDTIHEEEAKTQ